MKLKVYWEKLIHYKVTTLPFLNTEGYSPAFVAIPDDSSLASITNYSLMDYSNPGLVWYK